MNFIARQKKKVSSSEIKQVTSELKTVSTMEVEEKHVIEEKRIEEKETIMETEHEEKKKKKKKKKKHHHHHKHEDDPEHSKEGKENHVKLTNGKGDASPASSSEQGSSSSDDGRSPSSSSDEESDAYHNVKFTENRTDSPALLESILSHFENGLKANSDPEPVYEEIYGQEAEESTEYNQVHELHYEDIPTAEVICVKEPEVSVTQEELVENGAESYSDAESSESEQVSVRANKVEANSSSDDDKTGLTNGECGIEHQEVQSEATNEERHTQSSQSVADDSEPPGIADVKFGVQESVEVTTTGCVVQTEEVHFEKVTADHRLEEVTIVQKLQALESQLSQEEDFSTVEEVQFKKSEVQVVHEVVKDEFLLHEEDSNMMAATPKFDLDFQKMNSDGFMEVGAIEFREEAEGAEEEHQSSLTVDMESRKEPDGKSPSGSPSPIEHRSSPECSSPETCASPEPTKKSPEPLQISSPVENGPPIVITAPTPVKTAPDQSILNRCSSPSSSSSSSSNSSSEDETVEQDKLMDLDSKDEEFPFEKNLPKIVIVDKKRELLSNETKTDESPKSANIDTGVSVQSLKAAFRSSESPSREDRQSPIKSDMKDEGLDWVSLKALKDAYVKEASNSRVEDVEKESKTKEVIHTGVNIKQLRASWSDLTRLEDRSQSSSPTHKASLGVSVAKLRSRSIGNLSDLYKEGPKEPIYTGVSVKALRASYCDLTQLRNTSNKSQHNWNSSAKDEVTRFCKACGKQVFQMEQIKAEKEVWHKGCFRCKECQKQLTIDTYQSHEGDTYCKPHFKQLFMIKAVVDEEECRPRLRKPEMIIRENKPVELPEDVVRSSDKTDYGLEEISQVTDVKSRFDLFEKASSKNDVPDLATSPTQPAVKRSSSILSRMSRFQNGSIDGVPDSALNGEAPEGHSSSSEDEGDGTPRKLRLKKESIPRMEKMADVRSKWETGSEREERREEMKQQRKEELMKLRQAMCSGQTNTVKNMYQEAVQNSNAPTPSKNKIKLEGDFKASSLREAFERGESFEVSEQKKLKEEDELIFSEAKTARGARNMFKELDATPDAGVPLRRKIERDNSRRWSTEIKQPVGPIDMDNLVRASDHQADIEVETKTIASKFKFFETYKEPENKRKQFRITPPREGQVLEHADDEEEANYVKSTDDSQDIINVETTRSIRNKFLMMEEDAKREQVPLGPKPLKRFTPPPDYYNESDESEDESGSEYSDEEDDSEEDAQNGFRSIPDEEIFALKKERASSLRAKFERWESQEINHNQIDLLSDEVPSTDTARNLRAKFEAMKIDAEKPKEKPRAKVNRFI